MCLTLSWGCLGGHRAQVEQVWTCWGGCTSEVRVEQYHFIFLLPSATKLRQGNIFTSVCQEFCPWGGVCLSACWDTPPGQTPSRADTPLGQTLPPPDRLPGQTPPGKPPRQTPLGRHPPADGYCSARYASYWNAFLFCNNVELLIIFNVVCLKRLLHEEDFKPLVECMWTIYWSFPPKIRIHVDARELRGLKGEVEAWIKN